MTTRQTPWDAIRTPEADYNVRLVDGPKKVPLYWGRDSEGHCLFVMELRGDHTEQFRNNRMVLHGIKVDLRMSDATSGQGLVLTLEQHVDRDLFFGLCETLIASLRDVQDPAAAVSVALEHLKRWKAFLAGRKLRLLSREEICGLFAEIQFLRQLYSEHLTEMAAVDAWCGPRSPSSGFHIRQYGC